MPQSPFQQIWIQGTTFLVFLISLQPLHAQQRQAATIWTISPLIGVIRNEADVRRPDGRIDTQTDTAIKYGLFAMYRQGHWHATNFGFYTSVQDADVWGNLFFANWDAMPRAPLSGILGAGHVYHRIETARGNITVHVPMLKAGPRWTPRPAFSVHPYAGYAWEYVDTPRSSSTEALPLFGITINSRINRTMLGLQYYYQWGPSSSQQDYQNLRGRVMHPISSQWAALLRIDIMEHAGSDDQSILIGPVLSF